MRKFGAMLLAPALAATLATPVVAIAGDRTVGDFLQGCQSDPITCVIDMTDALYTAEVDEGVACPPDGLGGTAPTDEIQWMQQRVDADPAFADSEFTAAAIQGAQTLFPCA